MGREVPWSHEWNWFRNSLPQAEYDGGQSSRYLEEKVRSHRRDAPVGTKVIADRMRI